MIRITRDARIASLSILPRDLSVRESGVAVVTTGYHLAGISKDEDLESWIATVCLRLSSLVTMKRSSLSTTRSTCGSELGEFTVMTTFRSSFVTAEYCCFPQTVTTLYHARVQLNTMRDRPGVVGNGLALGIACLLNRFTAELLYDNSTTCLVFRHARLSNLHIEMRSGSYTPFYDSSHMWLLQVSLEGTFGHRSPSLALICSDGSTILEWLGAGTGKKRFRVLFCQSCGTGTYCEQLLRIPLDGVHRSRLCIHAYLVYSSHRHRYVLDLWVPTCCCIAY